MALLEQFKEDLKACKGFGDYAEWEDSSTKVNELYDSLQAAKETVADFNMREEVFKFPPTEYPTIDVVEKDLDTPFKLWNMIAEFNTNEQNWMKGSFMDIDAPQVEVRSFIKRKKLGLKQLPRRSIIDGHIGCVDG